MNPRHTPTPGPWFYHGSHIYAPDGEIIAQLQNPGSREKHYPIIGNRNLIAAAPDMLAALKAFAAWDQCWPGNINLEGVCEVARAAIAKAESSE